MTTTRPPTLDHVVVAVRDLDVAIARFGELGFTVLPGGRHDGFGTRNATIPLADSYLELLTVEDEARASAVGPLGTTLVDLLDRAEGAFAGFVVTAGDLDRARQTLDEDPDLLGPLALERADANGETLRWRLLVPGGTPWRRSWPMLIDWTTGDTSRAGGSASHANGVRGVTSLTLDVDDIDAARAWYERALGLSADAGAMIELGDVILRLRRASGALGAGLSEICLAVDDLTRLADAGGERDGEDVVVAPAGPDGAVLRFREARS